MKSIDSFLESVTNKSLLVVFPHPDDESVMAGGLIQRALVKGYQVTGLTLTEGNSGKIFINGKGRSVAEIRREEMALAMSRLMVSDWVMWKFADGKLRKTLKWRERLKAFIEATKPGVIVTYDLSGVSGHPDHIALSLEVLRIAKRVKNTELLWTSFEGKMKNKVVDGRVSRYLQQPKYQLSMSFTESWNKWRAAFAHRSQNLRGFLGSSWVYLSMVARTEWYSEANLDDKYKYRFVRFKL